MRKNRKMEIFQTAIRMFREKSYDAVSVQDICDQLGMTKKAFYYHYHSKEELIHDYFLVIDTDFDWETLKRQESLAVVNYLELYWQYELYIIKCGEALGSDLMKILYRCDLERGLNIHSPFTDGPYSNPINLNEAIQMIARGQSAGQFCANKSPQELLLFLFSSVVGISFHWCSTNGGYDQIKEIRKVYEFIMKP